jgi:hypothetical protein
MSLFAALKRRNVLRVAAACVAVSWLLIQVVETLFPVFGLSDAAIRTVVILLGIGFPVVLIVSWLYELTPDGFVLDSAIDSFWNLHDDPRWQPFLARIGKSEEQLSAIVFDVRPPSSGDVD